MLVDEVVQKMCSWIEKRSLKCGDELPCQAEWCEICAVSRTVVREAVKRLETTGLVVVRHGMGMYVGEPSGLSSIVRSLNITAVSPANLLEYRELRCALECYSARRAAQLGTEADVEQLEQLCALMEAPKQSREDAAKIDFDFHLHLARMTGNKILIGLMKVLHDVVIAGMLKTTPVPRDREFSRKLHSRIVEAIKAKDADEAEAAMQIHMDVGLLRLQQSAPAESKGQPKKKSRKSEASNKSK
jgi:GntR family transcriptional regulator, transcriptional repressor for pyruvate dehydrogenase complex